MTMEHVCSLCPFFSQSVDELCRHLVRRHKNVPCFIIHCSVCGASFRNSESFRKHHYRKHYNEPQLLLAQAVNPNLNDSDNCVENVDSESEGCGEKDEVAFLLQVKAYHHLSQSAISDIMTSTTELVRSKLLKCHRRLTVNGVSDFADVLREGLLTVADNMFDGLQTEYQQQKAFQHVLGLIKPEKVKLGTCKRNIKRAGLFSVRECDVYGYIVPFMQQLAQLLSIPEIHNYVTKDPQLLIDSETLLTDYFDGRSYQQDPFFQSHTNALAFSINTDDFEIVNPIGSHRKTHKITAVYWTLLNIPVQYRSKLSTIQLAALAKSRHVKEFGLHSLLQNMCDSLKQLYVGVDMEVPRYGSRKVHGKLCFVLADTLAAHSLGGFKEGVGGALKPCRTCEVDKTDIGSIHFASQCIARDETEHRERTACLGSLSKKARTFWSKQWGVNGESILTGIPGFDITKGILHDPMHDVLEGVARYELRAMLQVFIAKKYFTLAGLNSRMLNFEYSPSESKDKPQLLDTSSLERGSTLGQSAASMKTLMILLPCLIADNVPEHDPFWVNFIRLLKIMLLLISPVVSERTVQSLEVLIASHNDAYCKLYPDEPFRPKFHYLVHYPSQIVNFGPSRNHWCMRYESKNGFFKQKRWFNFKNLPYSLAKYHQEWMCLNMQGSCVYDGDEVREGVLTTADKIQGLSGICESTRTILQTNNVVINGHSYSKGSILLIDFEEEPEFAEVLSIVVSNNEKLFECRRMQITCYNHHMNMFSVNSTDTEDTFFLPYASLKYKWPQTHHSMLCSVMVMLTGCDDTWLL